MRLLCSMSYIFWRLGIAVALLSAARVPRLVYDDTSPAQKKIPVPELVPEPARHSSHGARKRAAKIPIMNRFVVPDVPPSLGHISPPPPPSLAGGCEQQAQKQTQREMDGTSAPRARLYFTSSGPHSSAPNCRLWGVTPATYERPISIFRPFSPPSLHHFNCQLFVICVHGRWLFVAAV